MDKQEFISKVSIVSKRFNSQIDKLARERDNNLIALKNEYLKENNKPLIGEAIVYKRKRMFIRDLFVVRNNLSYRCEVVPNDIKNFADVLHQFVNIENKGIVKTSVKFLESKPAKRKGLKK